MSQFADDSQLMNNGDRKSLEKSIYVVSKLEQCLVCSWLRRKYNSLGLAVKNIQRQNTCQIKQIIWNPHIFKIFGIWFTKDLNECEAINYNDKFDEVKKNVQNMAPKNDNSFGKNCNFKVSYFVQTYSSLDMIS